VDQEPDDYSERLLALQGPECDIGGRFCDSAALYLVRSTERDRGAPPRSRSHTAWSAPPPSSSHLAALAAD